MMTPWVERGEERGEEQSHRAKVDFESMAEFPQAEVRLEELKWFAAYTLSHTPCGYGRHQAA